MPSNHAEHLCTYHKADTETVKLAIKDALAAQKEWEEMPWNDRAAIFLKAADLISGKYREDLLAATILGQGKNAWQAEIDAAAEVSADRFYIYIWLLTCGNSSAIFFALESSMSRNYTPNNHPRTPRGHGTASSTDHLKDSSSPSRHSTLLLSVGTSQEHQHLLEM